MQNLAVWLNNAKGTLGPCLRMRHQTSAPHTRCSDTNGKLHSRHLLSFLHEKKEEQTVEPPKARRKERIWLSNERAKCENEEKKKNSLPPFFDYIRFLSQIHPFSFTYFLFASSVFLTWRPSLVFSRLFSSEMKCLALFHRLKDRVA